jgi:hypothetical protein
MRRYQGSQWVKAGYYVSPARREIVSIERDGGELPGESGVRFFRIPFPLLMIVSPILGAMYVVLLPVLGLGAIVWLGSQKVVSLAKSSPAGAERVQGRAKS